MALFDSPDTYDDSSVQSVPAELQQVKGNKARKLITAVTEGLPGMAAATGDTPAPGSLFNSGVATPPPRAQVDPSSIQAPDIGQNAPLVQPLPWAHMLTNQQQAQRPPMVNLNGTMVRGLTPGQKAQVLIAAGLKGALRGRASSEQTVAATGGRRSGGAGMGFEAAYTGPSQEAAMQQQLQRGQLENTQLGQQVQAFPQTQALGIAGKLAEIQKNISDAQKNRYVTPRSGGVYDVQTGQFAPGTEPQDKALTIDNLLASAAAKAQAAGKDPTQDPQVQQLSDVKTSLQRETQPKTQNDFEQFYGKYLRDNKLPDTAENMQRAHQQFEVKPVQPGAGDARLDRSYQYNSTQLEKLRQPIDALVGRVGRLQDSLSQNTPQADALVAPELLSVMAGGQGSGLRMNEAEISRIVGGRSNWESLKAAANKWSLNPATANSITPAQRQQIRALVATVQQKLAGKQSALDGANEDLVNATDVNTHRRIVSATRTKLDAIDSGGGTGTIKMRAPNGQVSDVTPDQVEHYKTLGATVVP